jgi:hypothetical protein
MNPSYRQIPGRQSPSIDHDEAGNPSPDQPGTLRQQFETIDLYLANPFRLIGRAAAWELARRLVLPHARRGHE